MKKILMKGNEAIGEAAVRSGCKYFFGYPITPQSELPHYLAKRLPEVGGVYLQAESEVSSINMVYGAAGSGARVMTSSSSPGISLMQEGISYIAGAELPCVIVNIMRGGPGLGNIQGCQSDYFQAAKGGGHGDYRILCLAPASVQEIIDLMQLAFDKADQYCTPVMIVGDGNLGQMMEPVLLEEKFSVDLPEKPWATTGPRNGNKRYITSLHISPEALEKHNNKLAEKFKTIEKDEVRWEEYRLDDAQYVLVAYGTVARICKAAIDQAREKGIKVGLIRPITLWPFPKDIIHQTASQAKHFLTVEMSSGQMVEDVEAAVARQKPVSFYGRNGGMLPLARDILQEIEKLAEGGNA